MPFQEEGRPRAESLDHAAEAEEEERRHEEARARADAERAALEQLKEENPEAYEKPPPAPQEGEEGEGALLPPPPETKGRELKQMAKTSQKVRQRRTPKYKTRGYNRCRQVPARARPVPQVRPVPDLSARSRPRGPHPRD